ncbi:MAG: flagellar hook-length control protein FliK [Betaproteobacteria bacterium]|nr:flagellar hook-length control protein FliK [Betaproteobacteria bacterium]
MVQQLRRNASTDEAATEATAERQEFAAVNLPGLNVAPEAAAPGMPQTVPANGTPVALAIGTAAALTNGTPAALATFTLGPTLQAITPASDLPDAASLQAFARSQGLDERAVQWLLGQPPARNISGTHSADRTFDPLSAATAPGAMPNEGLPADGDGLPPTLTPPAIQHTAAMPTDDSRLQVLAEEVIELLRSMLGQLQPTVAPPSSATVTAPDPSVMLVSGLTAPAAGVAATPLPAGLSLEATTAANASALLQGTALGTAGGMPNQAPVAGSAVPAPAGTAEAPAVLSKALGEALLAARSLASAAPSQSSAALASSGAPQATAQVPQQAAADVKQALLQLIAALTQRMSSPADASSLAGKAPARSPAADTPQPLGHQAMVFVRAVTQLQRSQAASAPPAVVPPKPVGLHKPLELEVDLTDIWIGEEFDPTTHGTAHGTRHQPPMVDNTPTARVLAQWQQGRNIAAATLPAGAADAASLAPDASSPAPTLPAHAHPGLQPVGTPDDLLRARPTTTTVQAASAGSDTGGYKPQDPDRGRQLADKMGEAVGQRMLQALERGDWSLKLALKPANLGHIEVNMRMHAAGLDAQFTASQTQTRDLLADGLQRLRDTLVQMGMDVAQLNVGGDRSHKRGGDSTPRQAAAAKTVAGVETTEETDAKNQPSITRPRRGAAGWDVMV